MFLGSFTVLGSHQHDLDLMKDFLKIFSREILVSFSILMQDVFGSSLTELGF